MNITENVMLANLPEKIYHSDPTPILEGFKQSASFSSSMASDLLTTTEERAVKSNRRLNAGHTDKKTDSMDSGKINHAYVLQDKVTFEIAPFPDFKTKAAQEYRDVILARGGIVLSQEKGAECMSKIKAMRSRLVSEMANHDEFPALFQNITPEVSMFSFDGEIWNRARADMLDTNFPDVIFDYKTTGLEFDSWERGLWNDERFVQEIHYKKVYKEITGRDARFVYIVQQDFEPYDFIVVELERSCCEETLARYNYARRKFINCLKTGIWNGAYKGVRHSYPPTYLMQKWEFQKAEDESLAKKPVKKEQLNELVA